MTLAWFALGLVVGCTAAWLVLRAHLTTAESALEHERTSAEEKLALVQQHERSASRSASAPCRPRRSSATTRRSSELAHAQLTRPIKETLQQVGKHARGARGQPPPQAYGSLVEQVPGQPRRGPGAAAQRDGQPPHRAPDAARARPLGEVQLSAVVSWPACSPTAISSSSRASDEEGRLLRPDLVVKLPGGKHLVVDAKAPIEAYLAALGVPRTTTPAGRSSPAYARPRRARPHVKLGQKRYWQQFAPAPEFA